MRTTTGSDFKVWEGVGLAIGMLVVGVLLGLSLAGCTGTPYYGLTGVPGGPLTAENAAEAEAANAGAKAPPPVRVVPKATPRPPCAGPYCPVP